MSTRLRHLTVQRNRIDLARPRHDTRECVQDRRIRARHLIDLGGLVQKGGLVELVVDDRATLLGLATRLRDGGDDASPADLVKRWRRRGLRAFDADKAAAVAARVPGRQDGLVEGNPGG